MSDENINDELRRLRLQVLKRVDGLLDLLADGFVAHESRNLDDELPQLLAGR